MKAINLLIAVFLVVTPGCTTSEPEDETRLMIRGSDTMIVLNRRLAEEYMRAHPGVSVWVEGGGSGSGVRALVEGEAQICAASRPLMPDEVRQIHQRFGTLGVRFLVAEDALSVYVNDANPVRDLSLDQLRGIFGGTVRSWAEVGGEGAEIVVVVRPPNSGTHRFFRDHVLRGAGYWAGARTEPTTRDVLDVVRTDAAAIGYGGVAFQEEGIRVVAVGGVDPSSVSTSGGRYPLGRFLAFYTIEPPSGLAKDFIDWCLAESGQRIVRETGFLPLWSK